MTNDIAKKYSKSSICWVSYLIMSWFNTCSIAVLSLKLTLHVLFAGTSVVTVTASDADDQTYGNSAKLVYSILQGQPYFSVDSENGKPNPAGTPTCSF